MSDHSESGAEADLADRLFAELWPLPRSLTGDGVRETHRILSRHLPLVRSEYPSGSAVFDWTVPQEWKVRKAYLEGPDGIRRCDFDVNNLHLVGYSIPFEGEMDLSELQPHLYSSKANPSAIPYVTSYYKPRWGFCLPQHERDRLPEGRYRIVVDTEFFSGGMTLSEGEIRSTVGGSDQVLLSSYTCHPSMANDQLSGPIALVLLSMRLAAWEKRRKSYHVIFGPETIGSIAWLSAQPADRLEKVVAGYVCGLLADRAGSFVYRRSRRGNSLADRAAELALRGHAHQSIRFDPSRGNDQRQFCSPGFNLPVGSMTHSPQDKPSWYHTSADNREIFDIPTLIKCVDRYEAMLRIVDGNSIPVNQKPQGEPFLTKYGLYPDIGLSGIALPSADHRAAVMWILNLADGDHDLIDITEISGIPFDLVREATDDLIEAGLIVERRTKSKCQDD